MNYLSSFNTYHLIKTFINSTHVGNTTYTQSDYNTNSVNTVLDILYHTINNAHDVSKSKIYIHSLHGLATYGNNYYLQTYISLYNI